MRVNKDMLPEWLQKDLADFLEDNPSQGDTDDHVELFTRYLTWNGIVGYSSTIREALFHLITTSDEHLVSTDRADTTRLAQHLGVKE